MKRNQSGKTRKRITVCRPFLIIPLILLFITCSLLHSFAAEGYLQSVTLTLDLYNVSVEEVLNEIEKRSEFHFIYSKKVVDVSRKVNISAENEKVDKVLEKLFKDQNVIYTISDRQIVLNRKNEDKAPQQARVVSGSVTDPGGEPIIGANVTVPGSTVGTITDYNGEFSLEVSSSAATLEIRYVGYVTEQVSIRDKNIISIILREDLHELADIVVVGYGVQKKENLIGAVDAIKGEKLESRTMASTSLSLQGMIPGMTISNTNGEPGADVAEIRIRGIGTFNNSSPLLIVDGVTVSDIDNIDPQDIENISVLKDAASSAIYGARAANGVILVTTKRGATDKLTVRYSGHIGIQSLTRQPKWVSSGDFMMLTNEACDNANTPRKYSDEDIALAGSDSYLHPDTDWWGLLFRNALQHKHTVSVSGGTEKVKTSVSLNYLKQEGTLINTNFEKYGLRANNDFKLHDKLDAGLDLSMLVHDRKIPARIGDIYWNLLHDVPPTLPALNPDGTYPLGPTSRNPLAAAKESGYRNHKSFQVIASPFVRYKVYSDLILTARATLKEDFYRGKTFHNYYEFKDYETKATALIWDNSMEESSSNNHYTQWQALADYDKLIGKNSFHLLLGFSQEYNHWKDVGAYRRDFYSNSLQDMSAGSDEGKNGWGSANEWALRSFFGRLNYSFNERYLFEANFRYDGSSRFAKGNRYGFFPSFSGAWRISQEDFMIDRENISNLKIRTSWGKLGNQDVGLYQYVHTLHMGQNYSFNNQLANGIAQTDLANELISWETTTSFDIGIDVGFWKNKLIFMADYYVKNTDDILLRRDIPGTVGLGSPFQNVGSVRNKGWELTLNYMDRVGEFEYGVTATLSDVKNKITKYGESSAWDWNIHREGEEMSALYGFVTEGLFQTQEQVDAHAFQDPETGPGDIIYKDINNDGIINDEDKVILGSTIPRYTYGLTLNGKFRNFDLSLFFNGVGKRNGYQYGALIEGPIWDGFTTSDMLDRWTPDNPNASWPRLVYNTVHNQKASDYWIQNTSYFRLKNFQVGYSLPKTILERMGIQRMRFYVSGDNVFTITKAKNLDPESKHGRADYYPQTKIYSFGIDVTF